MTRVFSTGTRSTKSSPEETMRLCGRLYYLVATHHVRIPPRLVSLMPTYGVDWSKAHQSRSSAVIPGLEDLANKLWAIGEQGGSSDSPLQEIRDLLITLFLEHIIPQRSVPPTVVEDLALFGSVQSLMQDTVMSGVDLVGIDDEEVSRYIIPAVTPLLKRLYGDEIWPGIHIFGAHPGHGKTSVMMAVALAYADMGYDVVFVETELPAVVMKKRFGAVMRRYNPETLNHLHFVFGGVNVAFIESLMDEKEITEPPILIVDIPDVLIGFHTDPRQALNYIYTQIALILLDQKVRSAFVTSHLTREAGNTRPRLAETSFKDRIATSIVMFSSEETGDPNVRFIEAELAKNRFGPAGVYTRIAFDTTTLRFISDMQDSYDNPF